MLTKSLLLTPAVLLAAGLNAQKQDIVDTAVAAGKFKTLATALSKAGLVETLKGKGPFTVFAPTDAAFEKVDQATLKSLLQPEQKAALTGILTYHVVPGKMPAAQVIKKKGLVTVNGQRAALSVGKAGAKIDGATIVKTDIKCSNGIIHVIDAVILPSSDDIISTAVQAGSFKTLAAAIKAAGLIKTLKGEGPFTVFAPTDEAFAKLPEATIASLLKPENKARLTEILTYHVVPGRIYSEQVLAGAQLKSVAGPAIKAKAKKGKVWIAEAGLVKADINTSNGVIHVIDTVIMPPTDGGER